MRIPPHLQPTPLQKAPHGFQLGPGIAALPLHLLQVAGVGLQGVEGPDGVLERPPGGWSGWRSSLRPQGRTHHHGPWGQPALCPPAPPPTPSGSVPSAVPVAAHAGSISSAMGTCWQRQSLLQGRATYQRGHPAPPRVPLGPTGGHRAAQHRAPTPATAGQGRRRARAGGAPVPARPPRWCLISGANEATELHLHGARGTARLHSHSRCQSSAVPPSPRTRAGGTQAWPWHHRVL